MSGLRVEVTLAGGVGDAARAVVSRSGWVERVSGVVARAGAELGVGGEVRVRVVGDGEMASAHVAWCGVEGTTDVITMDLREPAGSAARDGEIDADLIVCADEAARQAGARGTSVDDEVVLYVVHGLLHCMGHDDHDEAGYAAMHAREDAVLAAIGVGTVFGRAARGGGDGGAGS